MDEPEPPDSDARLAAISRGVDDVRDEMHASLDDVRRLVEQSRQAMFRIESTLATSDPGASLRVAAMVDSVRAIAERTRRRQGWLMGIVAMQAALLAIAIALIVLMRGDVQRGPLISSDVTVEHAQTLSSVSEPPRVSPDARLTPQTQTPPADETRHTRRRRR